MNTRFQSALNQIKADEALINKTEMYLREKLKEDQNSQIIKLPKYRLICMRNLAKAACILFILIGGGTGTYAYYKTPVAYLSLDINPSIELGVNAFDKVVSAEGYNADGKTVLNGIDVTGTNIEEAVNTVISSAADNGFINSDGSTVISLTSETDNINISNKLKTDAENGVNKALKEKGKMVVIYKDNVALAFRDEARALSITPGKLNLINKLQAANPIATVDQYKEAKVKDIMKDTKTYADNNSVNKEEAANSKGTDVVSSKKENNADSKVKSTVSSKKENTVVSKDKSAVSSKKENTVTIKDIDAAKNKEKEAVNSQQESAVSSKHEGTVKNNTKDTGDGKVKVVRKRRK